MCDRIAIMYAGQIVEEGTVDEIFYEPHHPYTKGLLNSINNSAKDNDEPLVPIPGTPPDLLKLPKGCAFMSRCPYTCLLYTSITNTIYGDVTIAQYAMALLMNICHNVTVQSDYTKTGYWKEKETNPQASYNQLFVPQIELCLLYTS